MKRLFAACASVAVTLFAMADATASTNDPFTHRFALDLEGRSAYYALTLPPAVYIASRRDDLGDLRVFNGAGEPVPYSLDAPRATDAASVSSHPVKWFPLPPSDAGDAAKTPGVAIAPDGTLRLSAAQPNARRRDADLLDLGAGAQRVDALAIHLNDDSYQGRVQVEASADLQQWRVVADATILKVKHDGDTLAQERIALGGLGERDRYMRLRWLDGAPDIATVDVEVRSADAPLQHDAREWREGLITRAGQLVGEYLFATDGRYPVDRIRVEVPQANTVVRATVYSRPKADVPWREVAHGLLFRLEQGGGEQRNAPFELAPDSDREWRIVVDARGGGLGSGAPTVAVGWQPALLTFVARGAPPFTLAVGNGRLTPAAAPRDNLLVGNASGIGTAKIGHALAVPPDEVREATASTEDSPRRYVLWGALVLAVGVLAAMVWRLARQS